MATKKYLPFRGLRFAVFNMLTADPSVTGIAEILAMV